MAFRTLFESGYRAFIDENRDDADLWFFLHIPKTAGSSFRAELSDVLRPEYNIHAYDEERRGQDFRTRLEASIKAFAAALWETKYRFASGHVPVDMMEPIRNSARTPKVFTMLRDPVSRFVSDFRYQSTPEHPDYAAFRARFNTIEAYLEDRGEWNKMTRYLAPAPDATAQETVDHVLDTFAFVGSMETYDTSFRIMMELLGSDRAPSVFLRKTAAGQATEVVMTPALEQRIREANARDVALYDAFMARLRLIDDLMCAKQPVEQGRAPETGISAWKTIG